MSRMVYHHESVDRFIVGTVGAPGEREFFLQVQSLDGFHSVAIEKSQVDALSQRLRELLREVRRGKLASLDELSLPSTRDNAPLEFPIDEEFTVGVIGITWDSEIQRVTIDIQGISELPVDDLLTDEEIELLEDAPDLLRLRLRINQVRSFCDRADSIISAGRQPCPFCGLPINVDGHLCPRANGYRR